MTDPRIFQLAEQERRDERALARAGELVGGDPAVPASEAAELERVARLERENPELSSDGDFRAFAAQQRAGKLATRRRGRVPRS